MNGSDEEREQALRAAGIYVDQDGRGCVRGGDLGLPESPYSPSLIDLLGDPTHPRITSWHELFLLMALVAALKSKDSSTRTGCVVVDENNRLRSMGFNGFPAGISEARPERWERPEKYRWVEHCDRNAIYSAARVGVSLAGCTMYLTGPPCDDCMRGIIQAGLKRVVWPADNPFERPTEQARAARWADAFRVMRQLAEEAGVELVRWTP